MSTLMQHSDPNALTDFRTPVLDLDNVYGRGSSDQPYLYAAFLGVDAVRGRVQPAVISASSAISAARLAASVAPAVDDPQGGGDPDIRGHSLVSAK
jgi:hypothetical protein